MSVGVAILGSTGSIGRSTLQVLARQRERFRVVALTGHSNKDLLAEQQREWKPAFVGLVNGGNASCLVEAATHPDVQIVVNGIVGAAGLEATLAALRAGKRVALANKETLVMAGELVAKAAARSCPSTRSTAPCSNASRVAGRLSLRGSFSPRRAARSAPGVPSACHAPPWPRRSSIRRGRWARRSPSIRRRWSTRLSRLSRLTFCLRLVMKGLM